MIDENYKLSDSLCGWYEENKRDLPWRNTNNPYLIWLSEIILQQTRVAQGMDYFLKFKTHYPTVKDLAIASEDEVLKDWQGLGYYSRARNLHAAAKYIVEELDGKFPNTFMEIKKLKGVGDYTAAAISSFAFKQPHAVVDGNVYRVLSRYYGIGTAIDSTAGKKEFQNIASQILNPKTPDTHNQAIMEFGALQCTPKSPNCSNCPISNNCIAFQDELINQLPFKEGKIKQRKRYFNYLVIEHKNSLLIEKREGKGIWQNLYQFPLIETDKEIDSKKLITTEAFKEVIKTNKFEIYSESGVRKHILSHQILLAKFYHLRLSDTARNLNEKYSEISTSKLAEYAVPKLIDNYVREETNLLSLPK